jgi:hypothetical protein
MSRIIGAIKPDALIPSPHPIQPQPQVKEWIELFDRDVVDPSELRHQLAAGHHLSGGTSG